MTDLRFTKAAPKKKKKKPSKKKALIDLNNFLKKAQPETVDFLYRDLHNSGNAITYKELRESYLAGGMTQKQFENWQKKYSKMVTSVLKPKWEQAAADAAQAMKDKYPYFQYEPAVGAAADWIKQHGAELVTNLTQDQRDALNAMISYFSVGPTAVTPDEAAIKMRACIGLTKPQALANLHYQDAVKAAYQKQHPACKPETLAKLAKEAGAKYAAKQHRYRAQCIARTELAFGYNAGAYGATKDAQAQGYIGECKKEWLTAYDERVCPICSAMDGEEADMDDPFSNGKLLPPAHPHCRCAVAYHEVAKPALQPQPSSGTINTNPKPAPAAAPAAAPAPAPQPAAPQPAPMPQTTTGPNTAQIPPDITVPPGMTFKGSAAKLGGTGTMYLYEDATGKEWLFKPAQNKSGSAEEFRAYIQEAGYKVQAIIDPNSAVKVGVGTLDGRFGAYQEKLPTIKGMDLKKWQYGVGLSDYDIQASGILPQLQKEHATDWLLGNFDSHGGNFVQTVSGDIIGIDKEQSFKYMDKLASHKMSYNYHPNASYGETEPIYNTMYRKYAKGELDLDLNESLQYIKKIEQIPDDEYREIFRDYAESFCKWKGQNAEDFLDAIVERKDNIRETYREFFSELETQRNGKKITFQFADEIAGSPLPNPAPQPKPSPKPQPAPQAPKPTNANAGLTMSEVLNDMSVIPETQYGRAIRSDGSMLEGLEMAARKVTIDGKQYYEFSGKLTADTWQSAIANASKRGTSQPLKLLKRQPGGDFISTVSCFDLDGLKIADQNHSVFEICADTGKHRYYSFDGYFRARVEATGDAAKERDALEKIFDKAGLKKIIKDTTDMDELALKKARLAWQIDPKAVNALNSLPGGSSIRAQKTDEILHRHGITDARVNAMEWKEVFPGHVTLIDKQAVDDYKKSGMTHVWCGVDTADSVVAILQSPGLASSNSRFMSGMGICGASSQYDMQTGGASSVFTRMGCSSREPYGRASVAGGHYRFIMTPDVAGRTDWYAYNGDCFGTAKGSTWENRSSANGFVNDVVQRYDASNEIMFRGGISKNEFVGISCRNDNEMDLLKTKLRNAGIYEINGIGLDDFLHVSNKPYEDMQLGLQGLDYYKKTP